MPRGIIIFGPAGAGKTTLGRKTAEALGFPYYDIDDYIWRRDTPVPFTVMYSREEKASRLMSAISRGEHFVMGGSMSSFNAPFVPLFDLAVHLLAPADIRAERVHARELALFGDRILEGGDMYEEHQSFLKGVSLYDTGDASPSMKSHSEWAETLPCRVIRLSGLESYEKNVETIVREYKKAVFAE